MKVAETMAPSRVEAQFRNAFHSIAYPSPSEVCQRHHRPETIQNIRAKSATAPNANSASCQSIIVAAKTR